MRALVSRWTSTPYRVRRTLSRFAGWLVTSPAAFFAAFVTDVAAFWLSALVRRARAARPFRRRTWAS